MVKPKLGFFETPPLRYVGSKWQIAEWIIAQFPPHKVYVEPFCGSAAVFFRKYPSKLEILNDLDGDIINFFDVLRTRRDELLDHIALTPYSRQEYERALDPVTDGDAIERARRFYVGVWQSFGSTLIYKSGWRTQRTPDMRSGLAKTWKRMDGLMAAADRLRDALIESKDAIDVIQHYDSQDALFYVDPPYVIQSRAQKGRRRYRVEMETAHHIELASILNEVQGMVVLSGYDSDLYSGLYSGWRKLEKTTTTNGNNQAVECLWVSPRCDEQTMPLWKGRV